MTVLTYAAGWVIVGFTALVCGTVLVWIWTNKISLAKLLSEPNGDASLSRLQFLIFTVVVSLSFFLITVGKSGGPAFPSPIPAEVLTLLGISASSYLVSKGIQFSNPAGVGQPTLTITPASSTKLAAGAAVNLTGSVVNAPAGTAPPPLKWALEAPSAGTLVVGAAGNTAVYTAPNPLPPNFKDTIRVTSPGYVDGIATVA